MDDVPPKPLFLRLFMAYYFCAGVGYVVTATFIVAIVDRLPGLADRGAWVFLFIGLGGAPACIIWDLIARRTGDLNALVLASALQIVGILLPVLQDSLIVALGGSVLFGASTVGIVSLVLTIAGRFYPTKPAKLMGKMTLSYGVAQVSRSSCHRAACQIIWRLSGGSLLGGGCDDRRNIGSRRAANYPNSGQDDGLTNFLSRRRTGYSCEHQRRNTHRHRRGVVGVGFSDTAPSAASINSLIDQARWVIKTQNASVDSAHIQCAGSVPTLGFCFLQRGERQQDGHKVLRRAQN